MGIGIGIFITCLLLLPFYSKGLSPAEIEIRARDMGMIYTDEIRAIQPSQEGDFDND